MLTLGSLNLFSKMLKLSLRFVDSLDSCTQHFENARHGDDDRDSLTA